MIQQALDDKIINYVEETLRERFAHAKELVDSRTVSPETAGFCTRRSVEVPYHLVEHLVDNPFPVSSDGR